MKTLIDGEILTIALKEMVKQDKIISELKEENKNLKEENEKLREEYNTLASYYWRYERS